MSSLLCEQKWGGSSLLKPCLHDKKQTFYLRSSDLYFSTQRPPGPPASSGVANRSPSFSVLHFLKPSLICKGLGAVGFPGSTNGEEPACQRRRCKRHWLDPGSGRCPWRRAWQPTPVFLPGKSFGQRSLEGYSQRGRRVGHDWSDLASTRAGSSISRPLLCFPCVFCQTSQETWPIL